MSLSELAAIRRYFRPLGGARADVVLGIGDDGALLRPSADRELVVTTDTLAEGTDFPAGFPAADVAWRALAVNLSDLAAMGATPAWATLALTLPHLDPDWLEAFAAGWQALAAPFDLALVGGDLGRGALSVTVTLVGTVPPGMALQRAGAKPGDALYVSGTLGDPRLYLDLLRGTRSLPPADADYIHSRYARPIPRVSLGEHLRGIASAAIDISDGLLADLGHLAKASALAASVDLAILPLSPALRAALSEEEAWIYATSGGDDYELLFTLPPGREAALRHAMASLAVTVIRIGYMGSGDEIVCRTESGTPWSPPATGYAHF